MSTSPVSAGSAVPAAKPLPPKTDTDEAVPRRGARWKNYVIPILVVLLAVAVLITITRNWNAWEGDKAEQVTDDAYVRGDLTTLSTKVAAIVRAVDVADYQQVHKGDLLVELQDDDYQAQVDQAKAAVEAARAGIAENLSQRQLQDTRIEKALAGIDQAKAQIAAAAAGKDAGQAELIPPRSERKRQEGLYQTHSTTEQNLEAAVATEGNLSAQFASRDADLNQAQTMLRSSELAAEAERGSKVVLESQAVQLQADLHGKQASLAAVEVNLGYTKIYAPDEGTVGERQVRPGQLVSPGTVVISFVALTKWVEANYRETQLTNVKIGDPAELRIDEYPGQLIRGKVVEIAPASGSQFALLPPDNATGNFTKVVQRMPSEVSTRPLLGILGVVTGAGLVTLAGRMLSLGLADLKGHVGISYDSGAWLDSAFNASPIFIGPFTVYIGGLLGPRRVLLFAAGLFTATSLFLPLIHSYSLLVAALIVAGMTSGTFYPLTLTFALRNIPLRSLPFTIALYATFVDGAVNIAPSLYGWYRDDLSWQWMFWNCAVIAPLMMICIYFGIPPQPPRKKSGPAPSFVGFVYLSAGLALI